MAEATTTVRKRPVRAARPAPAKKPASRATRPLEDEAPSTNYALRLTEGLEEEEVVIAPSTVRRGLRPTPEPDPSVKQDSFALKLSEALQAINAHTPSPLAPINAQANSSVPSINADTTPPVRPSWLEALDKLPPIKLPIGPAIPWKLGLPLLIAAVVVMAIVGRPTSAAETQGVQLPAPQTYQVQQEAPLFAKPQPTDTVPTSTQQQAQQPTDTAPKSTQQQAQQPIGTPDNAGFGFDLADIGLKLIVVLALAYGSLMLLKRFGIGGAGSPRVGGDAPVVRVVSSLVLAPNRSVHVIELPGGRTVLVGATPTSVNLLTSLDEPS